MVFNKRLFLKGLCLVVCMTLLMVVPSFALSNSVKNIILLIGDGMGPTHIELTRLYAEKILGKDLAMVEIMKNGNLAYMKTSSANKLVTDSAAAGTALATGYKTNNGMISVTPDGKAVETVLEVAQKLGKSTGLVTTTRITHATPAVFASHIDDRDKENEIAVMMLNHNVDVMLGGGLRHFLPASDSRSKRKDDKNLIKLAQEKGYKVVYNKDELKGVDVDKIGKLLGLFSLSHMAYEIDRASTNQPSLAEMTDKAIKILSKNPNGFFLMVEGGRIDHAAHANDAASVIHDTLAFDDAVRVALNFAKQNPDTLVIVTADHETGGIALTKGTESGKLGYPTALTLRRISKIKRSFESIKKAIKNAKSEEEIIKIMKDATGIEITPEEAAVIKKGKPWIKVYYNQPYDSMGRALCDDISVNWASGGHTVEPVYAFAIGPCSLNFNGIIDNTDVAKIMKMAFSK